MMSAIYKLTFDFNLADDLEIVLCYETKPEEAKMRFKARRVSMNERKQIKSRRHYAPTVPGIIFKSMSGRRSSGTPEKPGERQSKGDQSRGERME